MAQKYNLKTETVVLFGKFIPKKYQPAKMQVGCGIYSIVLLYYAPSFLHSCRPVYIVKNKNSVVMRFLQA